MDYLLRTPTPDDVDAVTRLHVDSWRETYGYLLPESYFGNDLLRECRKSWAGNLESTSPGWDMRVAQEGDQLVGFALAGPATADSPRERELHMIYVLSSHQGTGMGQRLLDSTLGASPGLLWVEKTNDRAQAFYRRNGFELDGSEEPDERNPVFVDVRMVR